MYTFVYVRFSKNSPKVWENFPQKLRVGRAEILNFPSEAVYVFFDRTSRTVFIIKHLHSYNTRTLITIKNFTHLDTPHHETLDKHIKLCYTIVCLVGIRLLNHLLGNP